MMRYLSQLLPLSYRSQWVAFAGFVIQLRSVCGWNVFLSKGNPEIVRRAVSDAQVNPLLVTSKGSIAINRVPNGDAHGWRFVKSSITRCMKPS
jgi:hypothetical protein